MTLGVHGYSSVEDNIHEMEEFNKTETQIG